jgi:hypothetical protein
LTSNAGRIGKRWKRYPDDESNKKQETNKFQIANSKLSD